MGDVPLGPGFPNPFGFDLDQLMRMLQTQGPVNLDIARQVATAVATADVETGESTTEPMIDAATRSNFDDVVRAAQVTVAETTGIAGTLGVTSVCVDRADWAGATVKGRSAPRYATCHIPDGGSTGPSAGRTGRPR